MTKVYQITPFLHVPDLPAALSFFCDTLGFVVKHQHDNYAYIELSGAGLRLLEERGRVLTPDGKARVAVYVDVSNVDELHAQMRQRLESLPPERVEPLMTRSWGQREFQVRLPDGDWMNFGQPASA
jgi:catechol 2,3-dioxygenase-like lactoylglutathione lyase family enzyme